MNDTKIKKFWERCKHTFAHIEATGYLKDEATLFKGWDRDFLHKLLEFTELKSILDYGIGSALLAKHLHSKYGLEKYIGIDIADRQLAYARDRLKDMSLEYELHGTNYEFSGAKVDALISLAVIQHFPDLEYLDNFLNNINTSKIPFICLEIRFNTNTVCRDNNYKTIKEVANKCYTNAQYINVQLSNYKLSWVGDIKKRSHNQIIILELVV